MPGVVEPAEQERERAARRERSRCAGPAAGGRTRRRGSSGSGRAGSRPAWRPSSRSIHCSRRQPPNMSQGWTNTGAPSAAQWLRNVTRLVVVEVPVADVVADLHADHARRPGSAPARGRRASVSCSGTWPNGDKAPVAARAQLEQGIVEDACALAAPARRVGRSRTAAEWPRSPGRRRRRGPCRPGAPPRPSRPM